MHDRIFEVSCIPYLQGPVPVPSCYFPAPFQRQQGGILILNAVGASDAHFWPMQVVLGAETLQRPVQTACEDHPTVLCIGNPCDPGHETLLFLAFDEFFMP